MQWYAVKFKSGEMRCQHRSYREQLLESLKREGKEIISFVERKFEHRHEAETFCEKINYVNRIIEKL
jgi:hypothetical protein